MIDTGVIHGRFQVLHNDHMKYLLAGRERCTHLVIGITNPDPILTRTDPAAPERSDVTANPLTFFERYFLIHEAMIEFEVEPADFSIVPFPINFPELYRHYVPMGATFFLTIYDDWGRRKLGIFEELGLKTEVLWERPIDQKGISASEVRELMVRNEPWEHLVPASTRRLLLHWDIAGRLRKLHKRK